METAEKGELQVPALRRCGQEWKQAHVLDVQVQVSGMVPRAGRCSTGGRMGWARLMTGIGVQGKVPTGNGMILSGGEWVVPGVMQLAGGDGVAIYVGIEDDALCNRCGRHHRGTREGSVFDGLALRLRLSLG